MPLPAGTRFGPYAIQAPLGSGGMGEVYRAIDTRLDRVVALKVLPPHVAADPARRQRFDREARALSSLNHPHICSLYDVGESDGAPFLVMEHVDGETLSDRLVRGALPIEQVVADANAIVEALEYAHRRGVVHRDLKPANIMLTRGGVKLLDFGIARLCEPEAANDLSDPSRRPDTVTDEGTIVGTLPYMAPEQLEGRAADARTDIFALGAIIHEMATGRRAFEGSSRASVIAAILERQPVALSTASVDMPPLLDQVVARCLAKDPNQRWQTAADLRQALKWVQDDLAPGVSPASRVPERRPAVRRTWRTVGLVLAIAGATALAVAFSISRHAATNRPSEFFLFPPDNTSFNPSHAFMAVSPDGRSIAFVASSRAGNAALWIRPLDSPVARELPGTEGAIQPFWSPDSAFIAFVVSGASTLRKIEVSSALVQTVAAASGGRSGAWNSDGTIIFPRRSGGLYRVDASGGPVTPLTTLDASLGETQHLWPQFLPDGRHFLYIANATQAEHNGVVYVASLDSPERIRVLRADSQAAYAAPGYLLFLQGTTLLAQPFDVRRARLTGEPTVIAKQVDRNAETYRGAFSTSQNGILAYRLYAETHLAWVDRAGRQLGAIGPSGHYANPALAPDERRLAVERLDPETGRSDIWLIELERPGTSRFATASSMPLWSPDGTRLLFVSNRHLYQQVLGGAAAPERLATVHLMGAPLDWTRDRHTLIYQDNTFQTSRLDLWLLPIADGSKPVRWLNAEFSNGRGALSPDGHWMAYVSDESGKNEVYVQRFLSGEDRQQLSTDGGLEPAWWRDGKELLYLAPNRNLMSVAVTTGAAFQAAAPVPLFKTHMSTFLSAGYIRNQYVPARDGQRILINEVPEGTTSGPIDVVIDWTTKLKK